METLNCEQLEPQYDVVLPPVEMCRLRHGLNENCLLNVFDYLGEFDLIRLCEMDVYYKELIMKWTVKKRLLNLREPNKQLELFRAFGKSIRKFKIYTCSFVSMLTTIVKHCEPGALTEIVLEINDIHDDVIERADAVDSLNRLMVIAMPFFSNLRKLHFQTYKSTDPNGVFTNFLTKISTTATNLRSLALFNFELRDNWLHNMQKLTELRLYWRGDSSFDNLFSYLRTNPPLKVFEFRHKLKDVTSVYAVLSESCPRLEKFSDSDVDMSNPYQRFDDSLANRYRFLSKFLHLNIVTLMSYTFCGCDLYYPLVALATKNIVKLKILMNLSRPVTVSDEAKAEIMRRPLPQFAGLHSVEMKIWEQNEYIYDPKWTQCDLRCQFLFHFLKQVKNLQYFRFTGGSLSNMHKVLEFAPSICVLDVSEVSHETHTMVPKIVKTLRSRQLDGGKNDRYPLHLILRDDDKVRIFENNNDFKGVINFTFTTKRRWEK